jgi:hypothetical protein
MSEFGGIDRKKADKVVIDASMKLMMLDLDKDSVVSLVTNVYLTGYRDALDKILSNMREE